MPFKPFPAMQAGSEATDASGNKTVTFPTPFGSVPKVFLQGDDASGRGIVLDKYDVTTTGFKVKARKVTGVSQSSTGSAGGHSHSIGSPSKASFVTGGTKYSTAVASTTHTHGIYYESSWTEYFDVPGVDGSHHHSYRRADSPTGVPIGATTVMYNLTLTTASAVTGIPGSTGSVGGHTHSNPAINAPALSISFDYLAIEA